MESDDSDRAYRTVREYSQRMVDLQKTDFLLRWDSDVMMPEGGTPARSSQRTTLTAARQQYLTAEELGEALDRLDGAVLPPEKQAVVREVRREHDIEARVPDDLNDEIGRVTAEAHEDWKRAREANDWSKFAPSVEEHFELKKEWASHVDPGSDPFAVLWSQRTGYLAQPHVPLDTVDRIFDELREALPPLVGDIHGSDAELATEALEGQFDVDEQKELNRETLDILGLDWDRTRFDAAPHPFSYGNQFDVRLTTRYDETSLVEALTSTIHEFGHTAYTHGLPAEHYGTPLGDPRGIGVHESQSRFFENHVARTREFWEMFLPTVKDHFPQLEDVTPREAYGCINQVFGENLIRVEADELTYHMHIILRTEIERELIAGRIGIEEVPAIWADKTEQYLGVRPDSDNEGCLQDPHWSESVPGFIGYTIGSVMAAQLDAAMREDLAVDELIRNGKFGPIREWLTDRIHRHGQRYRTDELVLQATGEDLTADHFIEYVQQKYSDLYNL